MAVTEDPVSPNFIAGLAVESIKLLGARFAGSRDDHGVRRTAHRRFVEWVEAGMMTALHQATLDVLGVAGQIDWSRASIDSMHVRALKRGT